MDLSWEALVNPKTWAKKTEKEKFEYTSHMNKESYSLEEVKTLLEEQRKFIASKFEGPSTLISNHVCKVRVMNSNNYESALRLAVRIKENAETV